MKVAQNPVPKLESVRAVTDALLTDFIVDKKRTALQLSPHYEALWNAIGSIMQTGGKRLRPHMVHVAYFAYAETPNEQVPASAGLAIELLHNAMLVHDDIIDRDDTRHGVKNISGQYKDTYKQLLSDAGEAEHYADGAAIIGGDLLLASSLFILAHDIDCSRVVAKKILAQADQAIAAVCGGELLDTESTFRGQDRADALTIAQAKTASYSFEAPLAIGAILGGASDEEVYILSVSFGGSLGRAYQLQDDLLGVFGDDTITGKSNLGDLREGKQTFLVEQFYARADGEQQAIFEAAFNKPEARSKAFVAAKAVLQSSGAAQAVERTITELVSEAGKALERLSIDSAYRSALGDLIERSIKRQK